jgi:hypothetical protein
MNKHKEPLKNRGNARSHQYVTTFAALTDKYLQYIFSGEKIPSVIVLIVMGWTFVQDNQAGRLDNWWSILWTAQKCSFFMVLYIVYRLIAWLARRVMRERTT